MSGKRNKKLRKIAQKHEANIIQQLRIEIRMKGFWFRFKLAMAIIFNRA